MVHLEGKNDVIIRLFDQNIEIEDRWVDDEGQHGFSSVDIYNEDIDKLIKKLEMIRDSLK